MRNLFIVFILIAVFTSSCYHDPIYSSIRGNGNVQSEERDLPNFSEIKSSGDFNVYIKHDSIDEVIVEAESNLIPYISTRINGQRLDIKTNNGRDLRNTEPMNIFIKTSDINCVTLSGSGFIAVENVNTSYLKLELTGSGKIDCEVEADIIDADISGSGDLYLEGYANETNMHISGSGEISSYSMEQNKCFANISGSGSMYVNVIELLDVKISGSGKVYYIGNPDINTTITGLGSVISNN